MTFGLMWGALPDSVRAGIIGTLGLAVLVSAALYAHAWHDARIASRASKATRDSIVTAANDVRNAVWPAERADWQRREDSLRRALASRDTVLVTRIRTVRELLTDTLHDTVTVTREVIRNACSALANDCDAYRLTANARAAMADSVRRADSTAIRALSVGLVDARESFARAVKWRGVERGICAGSLAANIFFVVAK